MSGVKRYGLAAIWYKKLLRDLELVLNVRDHEVFFNIIG